MITVVFSEWLMCFSMSFLKWVGPKQIWNLFVLWREGYKERRLQGRPEIKESTFINRVGYSRRPFTCNHQWMIPWTRKWMTSAVTQIVTLDESCNSVVYNVRLRIWPLKFDYFSWSVWVNVFPALGAFKSCLFWHMEGMMDMCVKPWGLKQGESSVFLMSCIKYCMGQTELLQMPHEALNHPGIIPCFSGMRHVFVPQLRMLVLCPGDTGPGIPQPVLHSLLQYHWYKLVHLFCCCDPF